MNVTDVPPLAWTRIRVATLRAVFGDVCLLADPAVLRGRRAGNAVLSPATGSVACRGGRPRCTGPD